ncbi:MAG: murein biosynthesis integral membrane protein MurJ [Phycisphaerales bacterium JB060]
MSAAVARAFRTISSLTLLSRMLGLLRDVVTARLFGDTAIGSAFAAAFAVPNTFRRLFGEGALAAAFVPEYAMLVEQDARAADRFATFTVALLGLVTAGLALLGELGLWLVLSMAEPGGPRHFSILLVMIALPFMPLICIAATLAGVLQTHGRFGPPAAQPILLNVCVLGAVGMHTLREGASIESAAMLLCAAVVVSGAIQVVWSLWGLRPHVRWTRVVSGVGQSARRLVRRWGGAIIGLGTLQVSALLDVVLAMWPIWFGATMLGFAYPLDEQSNAILFYAQRLYQFPLGVFGIAVATAAFPLLSRLATRRERFHDALVDALSLSLAIALPASVGLMLVSGDLTSTLFGGGSGFSEGGSQRAAFALIGYASCVWAYACNQLLTRAFYAMGDTRTPASISLLALGMNLVLNLSLIWLLREAGLAWATAIAAAVQTTVLLIMLARKHGVHVTSQAWHRGWKAVPCVVIMACAVSAVLLLWTKPEAWSMHAARLVACVVVGGLAYVAAAWAMGYRELARVLQARERMNGH